MSIQSAVGNIISNTKNDITSIITGAKGALENIVGSVGTKLSNLWDGGFAGIDENSFGTLKQAIMDYCKEVDEIINGFNQEGHLEVAYKGAIQDSANDFVVAVKEILVAYVSTMRRNIAEAVTAFQNYRQAAQSIAQDVQADAANIRSEAQKVKLD